MRFAPTSALWSAAAVVALLIGGCASTDNGDAEAPPAIPQTNDATSAPERKADEPKAGDRPDFAPQFETPTTPTETDPKKEDPGTPAGETCKDDGDAASTPALAKKLPETDDCNQDMISVSGTMNGGVDVDYYSLSALDKGISLSHPAGCKLDTAFATKTAGTEICVFARCKNATDNTVSGCAEGKETTSENGWKGCCGTTALPTLDCSGFNDNDSSDFLIRIKSTTTDNKCTPYKFEYRF